MSSIEVRVAEALSSGTWTEKVASSGKKFYVHTKTKKKVWNLAKELQDNPDDATSAQPVVSAAVAQAEALQEQRAERLERARRRQEEESQLNQNIAQLERQKIKLENEIAILQGPVDAEAAAIEELRKQLADQKHSVDAVAKEVAQRRKERMAELQAIQAKVQKMEAAKESEVAHREALKKRHAQLVAETQDLRADLLREQSTAEALRQTTRASELKVGQAQEKLAALQRQLVHKQQLLANAEAEVITAAKQKVEVEQQVADLRKAVDEAKARSEKRKEKSYGQRESEKARDGTTHEMEYLQTLLRKIHDRRNALQRLKRKSNLRDDVAKLQESTVDLKQLLAAAKRDREQVEQLARVLEAQAHTCAQSLAEHKMQVLEMRHQLQHHSPIVPYPATGASPSRNAAFRP